jgi:rhodanese-related sulfurtransferase
MGFFDCFKTPDLQEGLDRCRATAGAVLLDVREPDEYAAGHVPGSINLPLSAIDTAEIQLPRRDAPLFVYCLAGTRSARAVARLKAMGYSSVENIGGIRSYRGEIERI